jgi:uncharacterized protein YdiU (UPF0061 family)
MEPRTTEPHPLPFDNSYARLPETFYARVRPTPVRAPRLIRLNRPLAEQLGLDPAFFETPEGVATLAGNHVPRGADPLALAYAGHQFGHFVPSLGDGRALLLGEVVDRDGRRRDIQLKGSGPTPFSRMGDGRAGLGPVLREYVLSEAMAGLGIPTTRALALVTTGETVYREQGVEPGAILTRVATSHLRVGTFEYFARRGEIDSVRQLADYALERLAPETTKTAETAATDPPHRTLLDRVIERQAALVADWLLVGFIHGVMNTDNTALSGETLDYGPCAFMDAYHPGQVYSSIDHRGRYAYDQQPGIAHWNLVRFAETLLPLLSENEEEAIAIAKEALEAFPSRFEAHYENGLRRKLGLLQPHEGDAELAQTLLARMAEHEADFTLTFRSLADELVPAHSVPGHEHERRTRPPFFETAAYQDWAQRWRERLALEARDPGDVRDEMRAASPAFIPRNHRVQQAIEAACREDDFGPMDALLTVVTRPYEDHPEHAELARPPEPHEIVRRTFCGT